MGTIWRFTPGALLSCYHCVVYSPAQSKSNLLTLKQPESLITCSRMSESSFVSEWKHTLLMWSLQTKIIINNIWVRNIAMQKDNSKMQMMWQIFFMNTQKPWWCWWESLFLLSHLRSSDWMTLQENKDKELLSTGALTSVLSSYTGEWKRGPDLNFGHKQEMLLCAMFSSTVWNCGSIYVCTKLYIF